ncbi:MAG: molybdopterin cofactor-binding domain-containing protein [Bacillota bacterium]
MAAAREGKIIAVDVEGFGVPQATFAVECQIDEMARRQNMDPIEIRLKNILKDGDRTIFGQIMKKNRGLGLEECIAKVKERMNWDQPFERGDGIIKRGRGSLRASYQKRLLRRHRHQNKCNPAYTPACLGSD